MLELEYSSERAQLLNSKDSSQIECSIWFLHQRAIYIYIYIKSVPFVAFRKLKSLGDYLVRAKVDNHVSKNLLLGRPLAEHLPSYIRDTTEVIK